MYILQILKEAEMKNKNMFSAVMAIVLLLPAQGLFAQLSAGYKDFQPDNTLEEDYYASVGDYFGMETGKVLDIGEKIPAEEVPVALFVVSNAVDQGKKIKLEDVISLRNSKKSWMDITLKYGLSADIYFFPVESYVQAKPFGKAYRKFFDEPRKKWKNIRLDDDDIVNLVNLRFLSRYYELTPAEVLRMCEAEPKFMTVNREIRRGKDVEWILERTHHEKE
jgi:hypothetical protein